jgi:predicted secreted protein
VDYFALFFIFALVWWIVLFAVLPFGVKNSAKEAGEAAYAAAPNNPNLLKKLIATTIISIIVTYVIDIFSDDIMNNVRKDGQELHQKYYGDL